MRRRAIGSEQGEKRFMADKIKLALAVSLLIAGLVAFYYFSAYPGPARAGMVGAGVVLAFIVAALSEPGQRFLTFMRESNEERKKVVWPTGKESMQTAGAVFVFVLIMAMFLWLVDWAVEFSLYDLLLGWK